MTRRGAIPSALQMDLLAWEAPVPVQAFDEREVRSATLSGRISRAVSVALSDAPGDRAQIAAVMGAYLGAEISVPMLNAYASPTRSTHTISVARYLALAQATRDGRLIELLAEPVGLAAVERRYLPHIELAALTARQDELRRHGARLRRDMGRRLS